MKITEKIVNVETQTEEIIEREMTEAELAEYQMEEAAARTKIEQKKKADADRAALLAKLGMTADEAKLLLS